MEEIKFQSKWFERCVRDYLEIGDKPITKEKLSTIKYLYITTTNGHEVEFGTGVLPKVFSFDDAGDEWMCRCISDTTRFQKVEEFIKISDWGKIKEVSIKADILKLEKESEADKDSFVDDKLMEEFTKSKKRYYTEESDYEGLEEDEETYDWGILIPEDFSYLPNLEVVRLMGCELEIHSLKFLKALSKLRVLEIGEVRLTDLEGLEKLMGLEKLCIWSN